MIEFKEQFITPEIAREMLENNEGNRSVKLPVVLRYSKDILHDRWKPNTGEAIKLSESGRVLDGQHRLFAIIKADKGILVHVCSGIKDEVFTVIDTGVNRNAKDVFSINGTLNASVIPSMITTYNSIKNGSVKGNQLVMTNQMILDAYEKSPEEWQFIAKKSMAYYHQFSKILHKSNIGGFFKIFAEKSSNEITIDFFNQLCVGKEISCETILWLRKRLTEDRISNLKLPKQAKFELIIKTWNSFRRYKNLKSLRITGEIEKIL